MDIRTQLCMVLNLDKCIGCHTCSIGCKNVWTNRRGADYMWWNNVETKPGTGFPERWEDQQRYRGGWRLDGGGLRLRLGGRLGMLARIFHNPDHPTLRQYYEPWSYRYDHLLDAPDSPQQPTARAYSTVTGREMTVTRGPNWDDDLGGSNDHALDDPSLSDDERAFFSEFENTFMFHLPRLCNHCTNPACVAACPSGAIYKRAEDGIVLINQERCRGWRFCVAACPYKKVYFNWLTGKSEKCIFCYPRMEGREPTVCSHTCVGKIRYLGVLLYDLDRVTESLTVPDDQLVEAYRAAILDPTDPAVRSRAADQGVPREWLQEAARSPAYFLVKEAGMALPLHPEYRTFPNVFYVPPLSPRAAAAAAGDGFASPGELRIPLGYLARLFTAGNEAILRRVMDRLVCLRRYMAAKRLADEDAAAAAVTATDLDEATLQRLHHLFTRATYAERFRVPGNARLENDDSGERQGTAGYRGEVGQRWRLG